jgi:hypothetical protein
MTALAASRRTTTEKISSVELKGKTEQVWKGGTACLDTSTGLVAKAFASTTLIPIGTFADDQNTAAGGTVTVKLFKELHCVWRVNDAAGNPVVAANIGSLCYLLDDQTVTNTDATNTLSVAGRALKIDTIRGVLVAPLEFGIGHLTGLDF